MDNIYSDDDIFGTIEPIYNKLEDIPVSSLNFKSEHSMICYATISKDIIVERMNELSIPKDTIAYEYVENIKLKKNEVIIQILIDTSDVFDTTNSVELQKGNLNNSPLIRTVKPITKLGITSYIILYKIVNNKAVKDIALYQK